MTNLSSNTPTERRRTGPQCTAHTKHGPRAGERCGNPPIKGSNVCIKHGGAAKQVREKAQQRLLESADKVMAALIKIAMDESEPTYVRVVAMRDLLDRAGFSAKHAVAVTLEADDKWGQIAMDALIDDRSDIGELPSGEQERRALEELEFVKSKLSEDVRRDAEREWADLDEEDRERDAEFSGTHLVDGEDAESTSSPPTNSDKRRPREPRPTYPPDRDPARGGPIPEPAQPPPESEFDDSPVGEGVPSYEQRLLDMEEADRPRQRRRRKGA